MKSRSFCVCRLFTRRKCIPRARTSVGSVKSNDHIIRTYNYRNSVLEIDRYIYYRASPECVYRLRRYFTSSIEIVFAIFVRFRIVKEKIRRRRFICVYNVSTKRQVTVSVRFDSESIKVMRLILHHNGLMAQISAVVCRSCCSKNSGRVALSPCHFLCHPIATSVCLSPTFLCRRGPGEMRRVRKMS